MGSREEDVRIDWLIFGMVLGSLSIVRIAAAEAPRVKTASGELEGIEDSASGIRAFQGIPFAEPPVGELRWKAPQPVKPWTGVRLATHFGPRAMQPPIFGDMVFRSNGMSEDCLYLNVWTPAKSEKEQLPVLVYFYGGGFVAGDGSEPRYDGENMARKGIVAVTVNYRLGVFGFLAHPELTKESPHSASGNYGLLDQSAAIRWVSQNIAAFGGDPKKITIAGESAGSFSVCAQMASPLSRKLIAGAIGESGAMFGPTLRASTLSEAEKAGSDFAAEMKAPTIAALRAIPAEKILDGVKANPFRFSLTVDGYFLPKSAVEIYAAGEQARVPLLAGWNAEEVGPGSLLGQDPPTPANFAKAVGALYGDRAIDVLKAYPVYRAADAKTAATALASDRFIAYGTWKWTELHVKTSGKPVYRYLFAKARPKETGAFHAVEIEYALGNLDRNKVYQWTEGDRKVSATMQEYFSNFIKTGNPNGSGLPTWPANRGGGTKVMRLDVESKAQWEQDRERYQVLDTLERR